MNHIVEQLRFLSEEDTLKVAKDILPGLRASMTANGSDRQVHLDPRGKHEILTVLYAYERGRFTAINVVTESINWKDFRRDSEFLIERMSIEDYIRSKKVENKS